MGPRPSGTVWRRIGLPDGRRTRRRSKGCRGLARASRRLRLLASKGRCRSQKGNSGAGGSVRSRGGQAVRLPSCGCVCRSRGRQARYAFSFKGPARWDLRTRARSSLSVPDSLEGIFSALSYSPSCNLSGRPPPAEGGVLRFGLS